ncbi:protein kinase family protein [Bacillus sp. FJAT-44742]|uniref:protein kinase family protein n=1 Tax=Bacillus sp. FJAT-44742 TaxID=2014005 RepID=UPI001E57FC26|nr:protein kinase family protein [Bacillus sp. FJAT-44742]
MKAAQDLAGSIVFSKDKRGMYIVKSFAPELKVIGIGRSAAAFRIRETDKVIKVFFPEYTHIAKEEAEIYQLLEGKSYFPCLYDWGDNYLVVDYIEGKTLFSCLTEGVLVTSDQIKGVDEVISYVKKKGLNPSDIHLNNILVTPKGEVKVIDLARFRETKDCRQWSDLRYAFYHYYSRPLFPKRLPEFFLNFISSLYKKNILRVKGL